MRLLRVLTIGSLALAAACGGNDAEPEETVYDDETPPEAVEEIPAPMATEFAGELNVDLDAMQETESGLRFRILEEGDGPVAAPGDVVSVHYTGWLPDGNEVDSSRGRGEPLEFVLGAGRVIPGWDEGVTGMAEGSRFMLVIPPAQGYGAPGAGTVIPPNATLVFDIELLDVRSE